MPVESTVAWAILGCGRVADRRVAPVFRQIEDAVLSAVLRGGKPSISMFDGLPTLRLLESIDASS